MTRRVLHVMDYQPLGTRAFDQFIVEYAKQAQERGWEPHFAFTGTPQPAFAKLFEFAGRTSDALGTPTPPSLARPANNLEPCDKLQVPWITMSSRFDMTSLPACDVIQTSFYSAFDPFIVNLKAHCQAKRLVLIDHSSGAGPSPWSVLTPLRWWRGRRVGAAIDGVACVSQHNARRAVNRVFLPAGKVTVIPNGIDLKSFPFVGKRNNDPPRVVFAGQLTEAKGVLTLLDAVARLKTVPFTLEIAGKGPLEEALRRRAPTNVTIAGHVSDMAALFGTADVVVVPSEWAEAFGLVVIEAMACGAVVLASDAGALPEVVADAGVTFRAGDEDDLAVKLKALLMSHDERQRLGPLGRRRVEQHYQLHDCVRRHLDFAGAVASQ
jgi:glycosyltransferase involved in cell wall biosynthesis